MDEEHSLFGFFLKKAEQEQTDPEDFIMSLSSQFIKRLKQKQEFVKSSHSEITSHMFYLKILTQFQEMTQRQLKKCGSKLKAALDITITSAMKIYLIGCWGGVITMSLKINKDSPDTLDGIGKFKIFVY